MKRTLGDTAKPSDEEGKEHKPVLLEEAISGLKVKEGGFYIDATFGRGGHSKETLKLIGSTGFLLCIDKDDEAISKAKELKDPRLIIRHGSFVKIKKWVEELGRIGQVDGILLDLGVSSPQLDDAQRGFSFLKDGPLDMRMDQSQPQSAATWIRSATEGEIAKVLKEYGEERFSKRIANAIVKEREISLINTTKRLAEIVSKANPKWEKHKHPATRVFQAIRIFINRELEDLSDSLDQCLDVLAVGGRLVVISFHSLEDRIVKRFIKKNRGGDLPDRLPLYDKDIDRRIKSVGKKIVASKEEVNENPRSRSAVLRIMEKLK